MADPTITPGATSSVVPPGSTKPPPKEGTPEEQEAEKQAKKEEETKKEKKQEEAEREKQQPIYNIPAKNDDAKEFEPNKIPYFTPFVQSRKKTKTLGSVVEGEAYLKRYYSSINAEIYFNNEYVEDICAIDYAVQQQSQPLFGYNSYTYDDIAIGARLVQGTFAIRFTSPNYLFNLVDSVSKVQAIETKIAYNVSTHSKQQYLATGDILDENKGMIIGTNEAPLWNHGFDIDIVYGNKNYTGDVTHVMLMDVHLLGCSVHVSTVDPSVLTEVYTFTAKDIKTLD